MNQENKQPETIEQAAKKYCKGLIPYDQRHEIFLAGANWQASQHSYTEQKWISVEDHLPELGTKVIVYFGEIDNQLMAITKCNNEYKTVFCVYYADKYSIDHCELITHWMPLPKSPIAI